MLVDTFVNAIYLYDDKVVITYNYKDGTDTITFGDVQTALADRGTDSAFDASTAPKRKDIRTDVLSFWAPAVGGGLRLSGLKCSGRQSRPSAKVFTCGENACTAHSCRRPEGRLGGIFASSPKTENIDFNCSFQSIPMGHTFCSTPSGPPAKRVGLISTPLPRLCPHKRNAPEDADLRPPGHCFGLTHPCSRMICEKAVEILSQGMLISTQ